MKTHATNPRESSKQLDSEGSAFLQPPQFSLTASSATPLDGGGGVPVHDEMPGFKGTPLEKEAAGWDGEMVMIHSPCYSQEIEALALQAEGDPKNFLQAAAAIDALIEECKGREFQNAEGQVNNWADRQLSGSVPMNSCNMAATSNGKKGWPKLVVLTFWKDPSRPGEGGVNHSHFFYFPYSEIVPDPYKDMLPGGSVNWGDGGGGPFDASHKARYIDSNEWLPTILEMMKSLNGLNGAVNPEKIGHDADRTIERIKKIFEDSKNIGEKVNQLKESIEAESEKKDEEGKEGDKYVVIGGRKLEKGRLYDFKIKIDGIQHTGHKSPEDIQKIIGGRKFEIVQLEPV